MKFEVVGLIANEVEGKIGILSPNEFGEKGVYDEGERK